MPLLLSSSNSDSNSDSTDDQKRLRRWENEEDIIEAYENVMFNRSLRRAREEREEEERERKRQSSKKRNGESSTTSKLAKVGKFYLAY